MSAVESINTLLN